MCIDYMLALLQHVHSQTCVPIIVVVFTFSGVTVSGAGDRVAASSHMLDFEALCFGPIFVCHDLFVPVTSSICPN